MVTLYKSNEQESLKKFSIHSLVSFFIPKMNYLTHQLLNEEEIEILNMKKNKGHARCNAFGMRYIFQNKKFDYLILMDCDGEDRPIEIKSLIEKRIQNDKNT